MSSSNTDNQYPKYINDTTPPTITLKEYDNASWASTTCLDHNPIKNQYIVVVMENPNQIIAIIDQQDNMILDILFKMLMMLIQNKNIPRNEK